MATMPRGEPRSVPDPAGQAYDAMVKRERRRRTAEQAPRSDGASIDPSRTDVFPRGPDGKLHPVAGWHTTGRFDFGAWAHNVDWGGVLRDLNTIASRSVAGAVLGGFASSRGVTGPIGGGLTPTDRLTLGAGVDAAGAGALDAVDPKKKPPKWQGGTFLLCACHRAIVVA